MTDAATIVIPALKFGYTRYGPQGAIAAALAVGGSYLVIKRVVPRYTNIDEEQVDEYYEMVNDDEKMADILGKEFNKRFGDYFNSEPERTSE